MALQQINWLQIDTTTVPSGSVIDLGAISGSLHAVYADNLFISGETLQQYIENNFHDFNNGNTSTGTDHKATKGKKKTQSGSKSGHVMNATNSEKVTTDN